MKYRYGISNKVMDDSIKMYRYSLVAQYNNLKQAEDHFKGLCNSGLNAYLFAYGNKDGSIPPQTIAYTVNNGGNCYVNK